MKLNTIGIYKITSPTGKIYVGQSCCIKSRFKTYKKYGCRTQPKLYSSFYKHGYKNHKFEILEQCLKEELNGKERYWQDYYDVLNKGLNMVLNHGDDLKKELSEQIKRKISKSMTGKIPINRKKVICTEELIIYKSIKECALKNNINYNTLKQNLNGISRNLTRFKYYKDEVI